MNMRIGGITINGVAIGGGDTSDWASTSVKGRDGREIPIKFQPGADLAVRQVQIGGGMTTTLMAGSSTSMNVNGMDVRSQGKDLWVNGQKVDFSGGAAPVDQSAARESAKAALEARFPGVQFTGHEFISIDPGVKIEAGARIDGVPPGVQLLQNTQVGASARIQGGTISNSRIDGTVATGNVSNSAVAQGGRVDGGNVSHTQVRDGGRVAGGNVSGSTIDGTVQGGNVSSSELAQGSVVQGGNVSGMVIGEGAVVRGGTLTGFELAAGEVVKGGRHIGALSEQSGASAASASIRGGGFSADTNVVLGNVSGGITIIGDQVGSVVIGDGVSVTQRFGDVGPGVSIVGLKIDSIG